MTETTNQTLWQRREDAIPRGVGAMHRRFVREADNAEIFDVEGHRYIDFSTGIAVCNTGHANPKISQAVKAQIDKFSHTCFHVSPYESYVELAEKFNQLAPGDTPKKTLFLTTGAEAVENAIKIARSATGRSGIVAFKGGFHGRTMMGMALTGKMVPYKVGFGPFPGEIYHVPYPLDYHGITEEHALNAISDLFKSDIEPSRVAAFIIEPVQGEGGFYIAAPSFLKAVRQICDDHGILLICDEIQTGFARTGKIFATEHSGIEPDLMTVAKAMAGGYPISGVIGKAEIMDAPNPGGLGGTYGGSPLGCVASLQVLEIIEQENLCHRASEIGGLFVKRLTALKESGLDCIGDVRNLGAMIAIELVQGGTDSTPNPQLTADVIKQAADEGLLLLSCGIYGNVIRFLPALTASDKILHEGLDILEESLRRLV